MIFLPYIAAALVAAFGSWYITDTFADNKYNELVVSHQSALLAAKERTRAAEAGLEEEKNKRTVRSAERVAVAKTIAKVSTDEVLQKIADLPALVDPRCAWPDGVRDSVNRSRNPSEVDGGSGASTPVPKASGSNQIDAR